MKRPTLTPPKQRGFTLLEIIVVVAIIGTMVVVIGVSMQRDSDRLARLESQRFHLIVNEVRDEAILAGESYFLALDEKAGSYNFSAVLNVDAGAENGLLRPRTLEEGVGLRWEVLESVSFDQEEDEDDEKRVLITPLGEVTPFIAEFIGDDVTYEVFIDDENQLDRREKNTVLF